MQSAKYSRAGDGGTGCQATPAGDGVPDRERGEGIR